MPIEVSIIDNQYVLARCEGDICLEDFASVNELIYSESFDENISRYQIVDLTEARSLNISSEDVRTIASQDKNAIKGDNNITIAVVADKPLDFGLARMWEVYAEIPGITTCVFRDMSSGRNWIMSIMDSEI